MGTPKAHPKMALEPATYISDLNAANPPNTDNVSQADDHLRLIKSTVKATFPSITGAVNATQTELNLLSSTLIARSVIGNGTNAAAVPTALQAGTDGHVLRRSGTTVAFGQIAAGAIPVAIITPAMITDRAAVSLFGRSANSIGVGADIAAASNDHVLRRNTNALSFGTVDTGGLTAKAVTYAKIQDVSATSRLLGRVTAGAGVTEEVTLTQLLDFIGSAAQGDVLYRGAASWARLAAGTSGQFLKTLGAAANPVWATLPSPVWTEYDKGLLGLNTTYTQAHGLGAYPTDFKVWLECTTNDSGYVVGDRIQTGQTEGGSTIRGGTAMMNATNVAYKSATDDAFISSAQIVSARWKVIFRVLA